MLLRLQNRSSVFEILGFSQAIRMSQAKRNFTMSVKSNLFPKELLKAFYPPRKAN